MRGISENKTLIRASTLRPGSNWPLCKRQRLVDVIRRSPANTPIELKERQLRDKNHKQLSFRSAPRAAISF